MALPYLAAQGDEAVNSASFFVSLLDFSEVGDTSVFIDESQVAYIEAQMWAVNPIRQSLQFLVPTC